MKKIIILIIALIGFTKVYAANVENNLVCFKYGRISNGLTIKSHTQYFPLKDSQWYSITDGEQWEGISIKDNSCLNVKASRKRSKTPIQFVESSIVWDHNNIIGAAYKLDSDVTPDVLNFAFGVNLTFEAYDGKKYTCPGIILGQGSNGAGVNDWWLFSNNNNKNHTITCKNDATGDQVYLYPAPHYSIFDNHTFELYTETPPAR